MPSPAPRLIEPPPLVDPPPLDDAALQSVGTSDPGQLDLADDQEVLAAQKRALSWSIVTLDDAEWAMRMRAAIADELSALHEQAEAWRDRVDAWIEQVSKPLVGRISYLDDRLTAYQAARRAQDEKRNKTLWLPSGEVRSSSRSPKVALRVREDDEQLVAWAKANAPSAVKERVLVSKVRETVAVVNRLVGRSYRVLLTCDHRGEAQIDVDGDGTFSDEPPAHGSEFHCHACGETRTVLEVERVRDVTVLDLDGPGEIAGLFDIEHGTIDYSVVPK